jgi:hypothetical protein
MDNTNLNLSIDENITENNTLFYILSDGNPGAVSILSKLIKENEKEKEIDILKQFFIKIYQHQIIGARLWYIYKNECNKDINELLNKDLTPFTNEYFYKKFERYI